jgi:hypothetical protein
MRLLVRVESEAMKRLMRLDARVVSTLLVWTAISLQAQTATPVDAHVVSLTGTLTVQRARQAPQALRVAEAVLPGDELITGENSYATIQTGSGARVEVFPDSHIIFNEQSADVQEFLHLFFGSIKVYIERLTGRPNPHRMTSPTAVIAVRGTTFSVLVDDADSTLVAVDEGVVAVSNIRFPDREVLLQGGERSWIHEGSPPQQAQAFQGRSERADLAVPAGPGREAGSQAQSMQGRGSERNQGMQSMSGARNMGAMTGRSPMKP